MPGYVDNSSSAVTHDLYWLNDQTEIRELKEAVGSKLVWKYRLRFYNSLEAFLQAQDKSQKSAELTQGRPGPDGAHERGGVGWPSINPVKET